METIQDKMTFKALNDEGKETEYEVLFTFDSEETNKSYMVYTDDTKDEDGNTKVYAKSYTQNSDTTQLFPIETEKEWRIIETILKELQEQAKGEINE